MTFALNTSALKCSYGALYQALNKRFVSDLSASIEQEIMKDGLFWVANTRLGRVSS
jgi:hypothetical protein